MKYIPITWQKFEKDAISLAKKIRDEYGNVDEIIAISRGGVVLSRILSDILDVKISYITIQSYENLQQKKEPIVTQELPKNSPGGKVLLVDELADSGATFLKALVYLKKFSFTSVITCALYVKPHSKYTPHFYEKKLDGWIILPYELRETKAAFIEELGLEKAKLQLKKLGIHDWSNLQ